jgi:hypothetical protein
MDANNLLTYSAFILVMIVFAGRLRKAEKRLKAVEDELVGALVEMIDDQISELGGAVIVLQR